MTRREESVGFASFASSSWQESCAEAKFEWTMFIHVVFSLSGCVSKWPKVVFLSMSFKLT